MTQEMKHTPREIHTARHRSGIARYERECECKMEGRRKRKAYLIPGTPEAGEYAMLYRETQRILAALALAEKGEQ